MTFSFFKNTVFLLLMVSFPFCFSCGSQNKSNKEDKNIGRVIDASIEKEHLMIEPVIPGANRFELYFTKLKGKKVGMVANQTSIVIDSLNSFFENPIIRKEGDKRVSTHLLDFLLAFEIEVTKVFALEHGFRGKADAGETIKDGMDVKTGTPILSLYGKNKKPTREQLRGIEIMVFDIQDVGARFYTYISALHNIMEACAEEGIPLLILDRPNPNGHYIDGPILEPEHKSFVGMHPVPVVHGMTIGEYAQMINGEGWLSGGVKCDITVIPVKNYNHGTRYSIPVNPSPNLPNDTAINLYPSLCFFEGTPLSAGRGTEMQFQVFGAPFLPSDSYPFTFVPGPNEGAKHPKFNGELCYGMDLRKTEWLDWLNLDWLIDAYNATEDKENFFTPFFTKLAGTMALQHKIEHGLTAEEIKSSWKRGLEEYDIMREQYLLYSR
jgi:uncharacterized protein YbbC (DUF1343 family)